MTLVLRVVLESVPNDTGPEGRLWKVSPMTLVLRVVLESVPHDTSPEGHSCPRVRSWGSFLPLYPP